MNSLRQLMRQPLKTLSGVLLVGLAVAVLCVSFSQTLAAEQTTEELKQTFKTVALSKGMTDEEAAWVESFCVEHPEIVSADRNHLLASAFIPSLTQDNLTTHLTAISHLNDNYLYEPERPVYSAAMLEVTLTALDVDERANHYRTAPDGTGFVAVPDDYSGCTVTLMGTVDRVIGLEEGYSDPTGFQLRMYLHTRDKQEYLDMGLEVGGKYLIYTEDYVDTDFLLRNWIMSSGLISFWEDGVEVPAWHLESIETKTRTYFDVESYLAAGVGARQEDYYVTETTYKLRIGDLIYRVTGNQLKMFRTAEVTLENPGGVPLTHTLYEMNENGEMVPSETRTDERYTYRDGSGAEQTMTWEEHGVRYEKPVIVRLDGTAEEFLASEDGALWQRALDDLQINVDAYPVIGVEDLRSYADFAGGKASVTVGREFTEEELAVGADVCIISKSMAQRCGLEVGDTLNLRYFTYDFASPYQEFIRDGDGLINPTAYRYRSKTMELLPQKTYTIVGLYEQRSPWDNVDNNFFQFTPNTLFVPSAGITGSVDTASAGMFRTLVVESDRMRQMQLLTVEADMDHLFFYYDNGYTELADSLNGFREAARQILPLGMIVYGVLMLLYLFLFPGRQSKDLAVMDSLGAGRMQMTSHILWSTAGILVPGSMLGAGAGIVLWESVCTALSDYMDAGVTLTLDPASICAVAGVQALAVCVLVAAAGFLLSGRLDLMKRR